MASHLTQSKSCKSLQEVTEKLPRLCAVPVPLAAPSRSPPLPLQPRWPPCSPLNCTEKAPFCMSSARSTLPRRDAVCALPSFRSLQPGPVSGRPFCSALLKTTAPSSRLFLGPVFCLSFMDRFSTWEMPLHLYLFCPHSSLNVSPQQAGTWSFGYL